MLFIPIVPASHLDRPTRQARELNQLLSHAVREYRSRHPDVSPDDIRLALELTRREVGTGAGRGAIAAVLGTLTALAGLGAFLWLESARAGSGPDIPFSLVGVVIGLLIVGLGVFAVARSRGP
jgi:hypothetical protein